MDLNEFFFTVATGYDRHDGLQTPIQDLLKAADVLLAECAPAGMVVQGSGGKGLATYTPWVGFFDPDETTTPQEGLYVVYLLSEDMERLALTLNQGMEYLRRQIGDADARLRLSADAMRIRAEVAPAIPAGFTDSIDLRSSGTRQRAYEAGNVACRMYDLGALPSETTMRADLAASLSLYEAAMAAKRRLLLTMPGSIGSPTSEEGHGSADPLQNFRPKSDTDYRSTLVGRELVKTRRHETVVRQYGLSAAQLGFAVSTDHPKDLTLRSGDQEFLVEAKVVYRGNATDAVRAAVGQLLTYSHFLYGPDDQPTLVALFSGPVGDAYVEFLESHDILTVWGEGGQWHGSPSAVSHGLV